MFTKSKTITGKKSSKNFSAQKNGKHLWVEDLVSRGSILVDGQEDVEEEAEEERKKVISILNEILQKP